MTAIIDTLVEKTKDIEDDITRHLGFKLPKKLSLKQALQLITALEEPLRSDIKNSLMTSNTPLSDWDIRWKVIRNIIKFSIRFGSLNDYLESINNLFNDALVELSDKVANLLNSSDFKPTQYAYLKDCISTMLHGLSFYRQRTSLALITPENFPNLCIDTKNYLLDGDTFNSLAGSISHYGKNFICDDREYWSECSVSRNLSYVESPEELKHFKEDLERFGHYIQTFNTILDTKF